MSTRGALWLAEQSPGGVWTPKRRVTDPEQVGDETGLVVNENGDALLGWTSTPRHSVRTLDRSRAGGQEADEGSARSRAQARRFTVAP